MTEATAKGMGGFHDTRHVSPSALSARSYGRALLAAAREDERIVLPGGGPERVHPNGPVP